MTGGSLLTIGLIWTGSAFVLAMPIGRYLRSRNTVPETRTALSRGVPAMSYPGHGRGAYLDAGTALSGGAWADPGAVVSPDHGGQHGG